MANAVYIGLRTDQSHGLLYRLWPQVLLAIATFTIFQDTQYLRIPSCFIVKYIFWGPIFAFRGPSPQQPTRQYGQYLKIVNSVIGEKPWRSWISFPTSICFFSSKENKAPECSWFISVWCLELVRGRMIFGQVEHGWGSIIPLRTWCVSCNTQSNLIMKWPRSWQALGKGKHHGSKQCIHLQSKNSTYCVYIYIYIYNI